MNEVRQFVIDWNNRYPIDKWWRDKHGVAFGSKKHREQNILDMRIEFEEDLLFAESEYEAQRASLKKDLYTPGKGQWLRKRKPKMQTQDEIERDFNNLDIDKIAAAKEEIVNGRKQITF